MKKNAIIFGFVMFVLGSAFGVMSGNLLKQSNDNRRLVQFLGRNAGGEGFIHFGGRGYEWKKYGNVMELKLHPAKSDFDPEYLDPVYLVEFKRGGKLRFGIKQPDQQEVWLTKMPDELREDAESALRQYYSATEDEESLVRQEKQFDKLYRK